MHLLLVAQELRDYVNTAKELQKMLLMLHTRSRAATTIQSVWRGWAQRRRWRPVWEKHVEQERRLQAAAVVQRVRPCSSSLCRQSLWHSKPWSCRITRSVGCTCRELWLAPHDC